MARRKSRTRSRRPASIGSNQLSKRCTAVSVSDCGRQGVVLLLVMAWSPPAYQRRNRLLDQAGDYAAFNFQPLPLRHLAACLRMEFLVRLPLLEHNPIGLNQDRKGRDSQTRSDRRVLPDRMIRGTSDAEGLFPGLA